MENGQAVGSASSSNENVQHSRAQEYKHSGNDKFNNSNYKGAIIDYKKGLLHEPNNPDLHANLSAAFIHLEKYLDAEEHAVYTIHLRPDFYKGYMRAAKAAHGKGLTTLALKRLSEGLSHVTDPNGVRELNRLKNQYTSYLSLRSNADREIDCSEKYMSEDEDEPYSEDEEDFEQEFENQVSSHFSEQEACESQNSMNISKKDSEETKFEKYVDVTDKPKKLLPEMTESQKAKALPVQATVEKRNVEESETASKRNVRKTVPYELCGLGLTKEEQKSYQDRIAEHSTAPQKNHAENDQSFNNKSNSKDKQPDRTSEIFKQNSKESELNKHVEEFKELLRTGSEAFLSGNYRKAVESYKAAKERVGVKVTDYDIDDRQYHVIKYVYCAALINLGSYEDVVKAVQNLLEMETYHLSIPALYIQLARAYCKLNRFKTALEPLEKLQDILENCPIFPTFSWPGTAETIQETTPTGLKDAVKELGQTCRMPHKPTAVCRYDNCLKTSTHILPSELIYLSDPDFSGFVRMVCEEKCHIEFHIACWKAYKESISGISKMNDKDFLGQRCLTTDCVNSDGKPSLITVTEIIDADGQVKSVNKLDPKTIVDSKSSKEIQGDKKSKKKKCKLDDKERVVKPKKPKQKKVQEVKKPTLNAEEDDELVESSRNGTDSMNVMESRIQSLKELRRINFGMEKSWDPKIPFYGRSDEMEKWMEKCEEETSNVQYLDYSNEESIDVKDAKEFIFSYFMEILKVEKALKLSDVEELWKQVADDFCNIKVVLPNLKNMCELLLESTCFCQLEDYICLAGHLDMAYATVKTEVVETVRFLMTGSTEQTSSRTSQTQLPDLLNHQQATTSSSQVKSQVSSEDESTESQDEYISGPDSEESEEESSDEEEENFETETPPVLVTQNDEQVEEFTIPTIKPLDEQKFSLQNMLDEMSRVKNMFMKTSLDESQQIDKTDQIQEVIGSPQNDTFETAHESSHDFSDDDKNISDHSNDDDETQTVDADCGTEQNICTETVVSQVLDQVESTDTVIENEQNDVNVLNGTENPVPSDEQAPTTDVECDKASQAGVFTEERHMQTALETRDNLSQTKDSDLYKELNQKVQDLTKQVNHLSEENTKLAKEVIDKENLNKEIKKAHEKTVSTLQDKHNKAIATLKERNKTLKEDFSKQEAEFKQVEAKISSELETMHRNCKTLLLEKLSFNKQLTSFLEEKRDLEMSRVATEKNLKTKLLQSQQAQLIITKAFWENQVNLLVKRCVEKISEMHSWFSLLPSGEVEELPSWKDVRQITMQWGEIRNKLQQIQAEFQMKCSMFESKLSRGEEVDDVCSLTLPSLPDEPNPLPLDKIHKEITEKYTKRIGELTELVASQQLEIKKSEDNIQQFQSLIGSFPLAPPRTQNPMTTAFGGLALQYSYPPSLPTMFGSAAIPTIPPNQDVSKIGGHTSKPMQPDVQTLLQESSSAKFNAAAEKSSVKGIGVGTMLPPPTNAAMPSSFLSIPPPNVMLPPPPIGVAQSLLKSTSALAEKKEQKPVEQQVHPKPEAAKSGSSRESTPGPVATPAPTPEKARKKKKSKADVRDVGDVKAPSPVPAAAFTSEDVDSTPWSVCVSKKNLPKPVYLAAAPASDSKLKNKKRLLDKLQLKFPTTPLKDLDEIVKLVREQNNGSLSGLPFEEIETRVERIITKRHYQKSSTMGLVKFSNAAWGPVKQETVTWTNLQLEECTICLEPMGQDRTKVDCNHEFHTKCLRKWLKEKSVCPLCNKFTTMPDEFPAL